MVWVLGAERLSRITSDFCVVLAGRDHRAEDARGLDSHAGPSTRPEPRRSACSTQPRATACRVACSRIRVAGRDPPGTAARGRGGRASGLRFSRRRRTQRLDPAARGRGCCGRARSSQSPGRSRPRNAPADGAAGRLRARRAARRPCSRSGGRWGGGRTVRRPDWRLPPGGRQHPAPHAAGQLPRRAPGIVARQAVHAPLREPPASPRAGRTGDLEHCGHGSCRHPGRQERQDCRAPHEAGRQSVRAARA